MSDLVKKYHPIHFIHLHPGVCTIADTAAAPFYRSLYLFPVHPVAPLPHAQGYLNAGWLPFGLSLDFFTVSPGPHAAACTLIAYLRPFLINILIPQEGAEQNYKSPSITSMGLAPYATYILIF